MIYCTPMSGSYFLYGSILEKCGIFLKNGRFSGRIWPDWGDTARADMAGLGSIGLSVSRMSRMSHMSCMSPLGSPWELLISQPKPVIECPYVNYHQYLLK